MAVVYEPPPAMLQMDNDNGSWDVEYISGGGDATVKEDKMKRMLCDKDPQVMGATSGRMEARLAWRPDCTSCPWQGAGLVSTTIEIVPLFLTE